ncbi:hypothetical protein GCM10018987_09710 [Streptomyces cremeus]
MCRARREAQEVSLCGVDPELDRVARRGAGALPLVLDCVHRVSLVARWWIVRGPPLPPAEASSILVLSGAPAAFPKGGRPARKPVSGHGLMSMNTAIVQS